MSWHATYESQLLCLFLSLSLFRLLLHIVTKLIVDCEHTIIATIEITILECGLSILYSEETYCRLRSRQLEPSMQLVVSGALQSCSMGIAPSVRLLGPLHCNAWIPI
jgi:hypothetical protein